MPIRGQSIIVNFMVWDTINNCGKIDDESNLTLRLVKDGSISTPNGTPSPIDDTYCPGLYKITLTTGEMDCAFITLTGISSTSGCAVIPVSMTTELGNLANLDGDILDLHGDVSNLDGDIGDLHGDVVVLQTDAGFLKDYMGGKREKVANQLVCYKADNTTEICRFNTFNEDGDPAMENIYSRERVV